MIPIYIIHYKPLKERREYLETELKKQKINAQFCVQKTNKYKINEIKNIYNPNKQVWENKCKLLKYTKNNYYRLSSASINLCINHYKLWEHVSKEDNFALILEDDAIIEDNFNKKLKKILLELDKIEWDVCFIDFLADNRYRYLKKKGIFINLNNPNAWGTGGYLIKKNTAKIMLQNIQKFTLPVDEEFKWVCLKNNLKVYWNNPPLIHQGSIYGPYNTTNPHQFKFKNILQNRYILYTYLESKRFKKNIIWKIPLFIKDIVQEIEIKIKKMIS